MLEVWNEIRVELEQQNIRPVSPDADAITEITKRLNDSAIAVAETQVCMNAWADAWLLGWGRVVWREILRFAIQQMSNKPLKALSTFAHNVISYFCKNRWSLTLSFF